MGPRSERKAAEARPRRPVAVELAAALLIIVAGTDALVSLEAMLATPAGQDRFLAGVSAAAGFGLVALGLLIRRGRAWLLALNVVAVAAFLELRSLTPAGLVSAVLDFVVVGVLLRERGWFQWRPPEHGNVARRSGLPDERAGDA